MVVKQTMNAFGDAASNLGDKDKDRVGAWLPAQHLVYANTGWTGVENQFLDDGAAIPIVDVTQAVISYPSAAAAQKLLAGQQAQWSGCSGRTITVNNLDGRPDILTFGAMTTTDGTLSMTQAAGSGVVGVHVMAVRNNAVIDVKVFPGMSPTRPPISSAPSPQSSRNR
jgi:serine/threonine-protein kinase